MPGAGKGSGSAAFLSLRAFSMNSLNFFSSACFACCSLSPVKKSVLRYRKLKNTSSSWSIPPVSCCAKDSRMPSKRSSDIGSAQVGRFGQSRIGSFVFVFLRPSLQTNTQMDEEELQRLYTWIDQIPLSRPKRNLTRDFADGVLVAEIVAHFVPKIVDMHNYTPANSAKQKLANWETLGRKVFSKLGLTVPENVIKAVVEGKPGVAEVVLNNLRLKLDQYQLTQQAGGSGGQDSSWAEYDKPPSTKAPSPRRARGRAAPAGPPNGSSAAPTPAHLAMPQDEDIGQVLLEKDQSIMDYQETVEILQVKVKKLEQLALLKDRRIEELTRKLRQHGIKA
eukprot:m.48951 g.48951  ORF g.48951 m.48951 type:complete len:336 (+) comp14996_c0_seq2:771-1778(+)